MKASKPATAYTNDERRALLARHEASGMRSLDFEQSVGIPTGTLSHWRWRLRQRDRKHATVAASGPRFAQVSVEPTRPEVSNETLETRPIHPFELVFPKGLLLRVPVHFDPLALRQLLRVLETASC